MSWVSVPLCCPIQNRQFTLLSHHPVFVYQGRPLEANVKLQEQGVRSGATIHVMRRVAQEDSPSAADQEQLTDDKLRQITSAFKRFTVSRLWVGHAPSQERNY